MNLVFISLPGGAATIEVQSRKRNSTALTSGTNNIPSEGSGQFVEYIQIRPIKEIPATIR